MPDHSPSTDERASLAQPSQSSSPLECTSHLGFSLVVIEAAGIFGEDTEGHALFWSIMQYPLDNFPDRTTDEETPKSTSTRRAPRSRPAQTGSSEEHGPSAETEKELATVT